MCVCFILLFVLDAEWTVSGVESVRNVPSHSIPVDGNLIGRMCAVEIKWKQRYYLF